MDFDAIENKLVNLNLEERESNEPEISNVFMIEYDGIGEQFFESIKFSTSKNTVRVHIFFNKKNKFDAKIFRLKEQLSPVVIMHESLTEAVDAAWTDLVAYLVNFYTRRFTSCTLCSENEIPPICKMFVVSGNHGKYFELEALLQSNRANVVVVEGWKCNFFDMFHHVCKACKLIFMNQIEEEMHQATCTLQIEWQHDPRKRACKLCQTYTFCDTSYQREHMSCHHVLCACPCSQCYDSKEEYQRNYHKKFPLPCLENATCLERFKNIDGQALHHRRVHGAAYPYFCMACYQNNQLVCVRTADALWDHVSLAGHMREDFHFTVIRPGEHQQYLTQ